MTTEADFTFPAMSDKPPAVLRIAPQSDPDALKAQARQVFEVILLVSDKHPGGMQINHLAALLKKLQACSKGEVKLGWFKRTFIRVTTSLALWAVR